MNPNITVINDDLWAVNFHHIKMGYIKDLTLPDTDGDDFMTIIKEGKILINKTENNLDRKISVITAVMALPDNQLGTKQGFFAYMRKRMPKWEKKDDKWIDLAVQYYNLEFHEDGYKAACEWEKKRRIIKAEYIKRNRKFFGIGTIINYFKRKGVKNYGKY